jgi:hypothetical protein
MKKNVLEARKLDDLTPYPKNSRIHPPFQIGRLTASLKEFGWTRPIIVDPKNVVLAGHGILQAAKRVRDEGGKVKDWPDTSTAPVVVKKGLTEAQKRAYVIADNKLAEGSRWDQEALAGELKELMAADFDLLITGLGAGEITQLLEPGGKGGVKPEVEFSEELLLEHNYIVLYFDNPLDWQVAVDKFKLKKVRDLIERKGQPKGLGRVVRGAEWLPRIQ